jgi:hypothetical protein
MSKPLKTKLGYALLAAVPATVVLGAVMGRKKMSAAPVNQKPEPARRRGPKFNLS